MTDITTTLEHCYKRPEGRHQLLMAVPYYRPSETILVRDLVRVIGVDAVLWILEEDHRDIALQFAIRCTRRVMPIWNRCYPLDRRPGKALDYAVNGKCISTIASHVAMSADKAALMAHDADQPGPEMVAHLARFVCDEVYGNRQSTPLGVLPDIARQALGGGRFRQWRFKRWSERTLRGML